MGRAEVHYAKKHDFLGAEQRCFAVIQYHVCMDISEAAAELGSIVMVCESLDSLLVTHTLNFDLIFLTFLPNSLAREHPLPKETHSMS
jgi:hypothetical protein